MPISIPLKLKHRNPNSALLHRDGIDPVGGTLVFRAGKYKSPGSNSGKKQLLKQGTGHRRRQGLGAVGH